VGLFGAEASNFNEAYKYVKRKPEKPAETGALALFSWRKPQKLAF
jgi:hypothetical protein